MNHLSAWITKQEDIERDCEALGGIVHDTEIPIVVDAMIRMIGTQDTSYLPWKNLQRDETRQKIPGTLVIHQVTANSGIRKSPVVAEKNPKGGLEGSVLPIYTGQHHETSVCVDNKAGGY